jgi:sulfate adenylyltransferase subunit 1 (EFTu-like GTPase family)
VNDFLRDTGRPSAPVVWFTGMSGVGTSTIDERVAERFSAGAFSARSSTAARSLPVDAYADSRYTGSMILIDWRTIATIGAPMVEGLAG